MKKLTLFLSLILWFASSCRKEDENSVIISDKYKPRKYIITTVLGIVHNEENQTIEGAKVRLGDQTTYSDKNGYYKFTKVKIDELQDFIQIEHISYLSAITKISAYPGSYHTINVSLPRKASAIQHNNANKNIYKLNEDYNIEIDSASLINSVNQVEKGLCFLYIRKNNSIPCLIDQNLLVTYNSSNLVQLIETNDKFALEFRSTVNGEILRLNKKIKIIPSKQIPQDEKIIYLNDSSLIWENAIETNQSFSIPIDRYFAIGKNKNYKILEGNVLDQSKNNAGLQELKISRNNQNIDRITSDSDGRFISIIPLESYSIGLIDLCNQVANTKTIQTEIKKIDLEINSNNSKLSLLNGKAISCNGEIISNGYAIIRTENNKILVSPILTNGEFKKSLLTCKEISCSLSLYDSDKMEMSNPFTFNTSQSLQITINTCSSEVESLARFIVGAYSMNYPYCRVKKITSPNNPNAIFIFEYGTNKTYSEKLILERKNDPITGNYWRFSQASLINGRYSLHEIIHEPQLFFFEENGTEFLECSIPKVNCIDQQTQTNIQSQLIYFKAEII